MLKDNLLLLRNLHGYSQEELAERIGISRQAYAKWENGATIPDVEKCSLLAKLYNTTIDGLMTTEKLESMEATIPPPPRGRNIWGSVVINERGQLVIPKAVRDRFGFTGGQRLILLTDDREGIALVPAEWFDAKLKKAMELAATELENIPPD